MQEKVIKAILVAKQCTQYTTYVFKDLDTKEYIICTRLPSWDIPELNINECGFITVQIVEAGEKYYDRKKDEQSTYQYTGNYITKYIRYEDEINGLLRL